MLRQALYVCKSLSRVSRCSASRPRVTCVEVNARVVLRCACLCFWRALVQSAKAEQNTLILFSKQESVIFVYLLALSHANHKNHLWNIHVISFQDILFGMAQVFGVFLAGCGGASLALAMVTQRYALDPTTGGGDPHKVISAGLYSMWG